MTLTEVPSSFSQTVRYGWPSTFIVCKVSLLLALEKGG
jgi:hypothetical protein